MPRRRGGHQSVAVSPLDMLEEELISFQTQQENLYALVCAIGTADDSVAVRQAITELKKILAVAESSISNRVKGEVPEHEIERHATLEDGFFELKANYFALLRRCVAAESTPLEGITEPPQPVMTGGPDIQRFGNPHATPELQNMQPPPVHRPIPAPPSQMNSMPMEYENNGSYSPQEPVYPNRAPPVPNSNQMQQQVQSNAISIDGIELQKRESVFWDAKEYVERNEELQFISSEMVHLEEAFQDMATEVDVQAEQEEIVEKQVEEAKVNTKEGVQTLGKSAKNSKKVLLPGAGAGICGVAGASAGAVLGTFAFGGLTIPGAVVGGAIGVGVGATFGHGVGKVIRKYNDKDMAKSRLSEDWRPDSSTKNCESCAKKFTQVKRRHHCRNCGGIFCNKCSKHRMFIPGVATESRPRVCRKCFEALMYYQQGIKPPSNDKSDSTSELPEIPPNNSLPPVPARPQ